MTETVPERMARRRKEREERQQARDAGKAARQAEREGVLKKIEQPLSGFSDEQLLAEVLRRNPPQPGPKSVTFVEPVQVCTIGIGKDNVASVYLFADDKEALNDLAS